MRAFEERVRSGWGVFGQIAKGSFEFADSLMEGFGRGEDESFAFAAFELAFGTDSCVIIKREEKGQIGRETSVRDRSQGLELTLRPPERSSKESEMS